MTSMTRSRPGSFEAGKLDACRLRREARPSGGFRNLPGSVPGRHAQDGARPVIFKIEPIKEGE